MAITESGLKIRDSKPLPLQPTWIKSCRAEFKALARKHGISPRLAASSDRPKRRLEPFSLIKSRIATKFVHILECAH